MCARFIAAFGLALTFFAFSPGVASAARMSIVRFYSVDGDDTTAAFMSTAFHAAAEHVPGWEPAFATDDLYTIMGRGGCGDLTEPSVTCLVGLANTAGSGVHATLVVYGFLRRVGTDADPFVEVDLAFFDYNRTSITHYIVTVRRSRLQDESVRGRIAEAIVLRMVAPPSAEPILPELASEPPGVTAVPSAEVSVPIVTLATPSASGGNQYLQIFGWGMIAASAVMLVGDIVVWSRLADTQSNPEFIAFRSSFGPGAGNVCDQPSNGSDLDRIGHSYCGHAATLEVMQAVFSIVGLALLGGGIGMLYEGYNGTGSPPAADHAFFIHPTISTTRLGLDLGFRF